MQTMFERATYDETVRRLDALRPDAERQWGKMSPAQMLEHTARALEMALGKRGGKQALLGRLIGWTVYKDFVGEKPFGKNGPTAPDFIIANEPDFAAAKARVKALLAELHEKGEQGCDGHVHSFFGRMSGAHWGVTQYKHLDHHLRQFGA